MIKIIIAVIGLSMMLFTSCNNSSSPADRAPDSGSEIRNGEVHINYQETKRGDTTLFFIHGWNINQTYWDHQKEHFSDHYRVVTIDLPGFGSSGKNRNAWTVEEYGKDITTLVNELDLKNIILIGHSMSGAIILEAASNNSSRVIGIVGVDNFTNFGAVLTDEIKKAIAEAYRKLRTNYREVTLRFANESLFSPSTDSMVRERVIKDFLNADSVIAINVLEENDKFPIDAKLKDLGKKLYLINSNFHSTDTAAFTRNNIPYLFLNIGSTGHYPMIENPEKFNSLLTTAIRDMERELKRN